jgi:ubiquinone/menaquinone biosynthesis C-methylase UbiE
LRGCKVLDIGCGTGKFMVRLHSTYPRSEVIGIDPYADQIKRANRSTPEHTNLKILCGSGETMNFRNEFDFIYLGESMYLMDNKQAALRNCYRALRSGGTIAILEGLMTDKENEISDENKLVRSMQLDFVLQGHEFMTKRQIAGLLRRARFKNVKFINLGVSFYLVTANRR